MTTSIRSISGFEYDKPNACDFAHLLSKTNQISVIFITNKINQIWVILGTHSKTSQIHVVLTIPNETNQISRVFTTHNKTNNIWGVMPTSIRCGPTIAQALMRWTRGLPVLIAFSMTSQIRWSNKASLWRHHKSNY